MRNSGELDDDKECRFCKNKSHTVEDCKKLKALREKLKQYKLIDIVAIIADQGKELPYFSLDIQTKKGKKTSVMHD